MHPLYDSAEHRIDELIEAQCARTPHAPAVVSDMEILTYGALSRATNALACKLQQLGVGPEALAGVYMEKSPAMIIGILAILKAGGAYVPMDPSAPSGRLADAPLSIILTQPHLEGRLASHRAPKICVDRPTSAASTGVAPEPLAGPDNLAYVIYTSGSSGTPKGVAVEHRSLVLSTLARHAWYPAPKAFLLLSAVAFDSAVAGIFGTLTCGGALCLPPPGTEADARLISAFIARHQIDTFLALPSLYELLLEAAEPAQLASLRTVTVAGERCPPSLLSLSRAVVPAVELVNEYGPTESTVWTTAWRAPQQASSELTSVPIGRAIEGLRIAVVGTDGDLVTGDAAGELCIAGAALARGYFGRPDLTAAVFEPDPIGPPGARRYRTGDLVRYRADGELEYLGRIDRQLKIRGYRIEPGEIEDVLRQHPGVRQAAVVMVTQAAHTMLAAFVTGDRIDRTALRAFLRQRLPSYMVPADIRHVDALPLTTNGKVDLRALEAAALRPIVVRSTDEPRPGSERLVARIWCEVLGLEHIGRTQSFFDLGGSLQVVHIALRLSQLLETQVPLLWVYEASTIESLAQWLENNTCGAMDTAAERFALHDAA